VLEEFDTYCNHKNQSLLYNLFDIAQSRAVPICVIGVTCQIDVTELLEKRVKSRFSHRHLNLMHFESLTEYLEMFKAFLILDKSCNVPDFQAWNKMVEKTIARPDIQNFIEDKVFVYDKSISFIRQLVHSILVCMLAQGEQQKLSLQLFEAGLQQSCASFSVQPLDVIIKDLSILEVCILIAVKHITEIYDHEPFNFEMVYHEYVKFRRRRLTNLTEERSVIFKCWENLLGLEMIIPKVSGEKCRSQQAEYILNVFHIPVSTLKKAVEKYPYCPTEVLQWLTSSTHNSASFS
jgi:origin recognition complex subunit 4